MGPTYNCPDCDEKHFCSVCGAKTLAYYREKFRTRSGNPVPEPKKKKAKAVPAKKIITRAKKNFVFNRYKYPAIVPEKRQWKVKVFERDGYRCVCCGENQTLLTAVVINPDKGRVKDNLKTLCLSCKSNT